MPSTIFNKVVTEFLIAAIDEQTEQAKQKDMVAKSNSVLSFAKRAVFHRDIVASESKRALLVALKNEITINPDVLEINDPLRKEFLIGRLRTYYTQVESITKKHNLANATTEPLLQALENFTRFFYDKVHQHQLTNRPIPETGNPLFIFAHCLQAYAYHFARRQFDNTVTKKSVVGQGYDALTNSFNNSLDDHVEEKLTEIWAITRRFTSEESTELSAENTLGFLCLNASRDFEIALASGRISVPTYFRHFISEALKKIAEQKPTRIRLGSIRSDSSDQALVSKQGLFAPEVVASSSEIDQNDEELVDVPLDSAVTSSQPKKK